MTHQRWFHCLSLIVLCIVAYVPGQWSIPPVDRDEARFAQATRQMIESGDYITIRFQDDWRNKKPAGIHWLQAASVRLFSDASATTMWPYRLPSLLGAMVAVLTLYAAGCRLVEPRAAWLAAAMLGSSILLIAEAHLATTDAVLLALCTIAFSTLASAYVQRGDDHVWGRSFLLWTAVGLGALVKGPLILFFVMLAMATLIVADRELRVIRHVHPLLGVPWAALIVTPWYVMVQRATEGAFIRDAFMEDLWTKLVSGQESHGFPPLFYLVLLPITFFPGSLFAARALMTSWRERQDSRIIRFCLAWLIPAWIVLELVPTKLPHYVLPLYPALAILVAITISRPGFETRIGDKVGLSVWVVLAALGLASFMFLTTQTVAVAAMALLGVIGLVIACRFVLQHQPARAMVSSAFATALVCGFALWIIVPNQRFWPSRDVFRATQALREEHPELAVVAVDYHEPSVVFLCGTDTQLVGARKAAEILATTSVPVVVFTTQAAEPALEAAALELGVELGEPTRVTPRFTRNLVKGGWIQIKMYVGE